MLNRKNHIVVGLTTFHNEMLRISVPALGKLGRKFLLIVFNDNPLTTVTRRQIRNLGYRGELQIINSAQNVGLMRARLAIVAAAAKVKPTPTWIVFNDDDNMIVNLDDVPNVSADSFAILQNSLILRHRIATLMRALGNPDDCVPDGTDIVLDKPHVALGGSLVRLETMVGVCAVMQQALPEIVAIDEGLSFMPPTDAIMWNFVNMYARSVNPAATPIYMDRINQIITDLDSAPTKYGRAAAAHRGSGDAMMNILSRYEAAFRAALDAAALRG